MISSDLGVKVIQLMIQPVVMGPSTGWVGGEGGGSCDLHVIKKRSYISPFGIVKT